MGTSQLVATSVPQLMTYYHTGFRNVGVATSLGLLALAARRFYHDKDNTLECLFLMAAFIFFVIALVFAISVYQDVNEADHALARQSRLTTMGTNTLSKWLNVFIAMIIILVLMLAFVGWLVIRVMT